MEHSSHEQIQNSEFSEVSAPINPKQEEISGSIRPSPGEADPQRQQALGFMLTHSLLSDTNRNLLSASTAAFALADLLIEREIIDEGEFKARRDQVQALLLEQAQQHGLGLFVNEQNQDKYALTDLPQINCAERLHLCKAACCLLIFPLSRQDVEEGIARWDFGRPYWNLRDRTGYCVHNDPEKHSCHIYNERPAPCRVYDCRQDKRIWLDFDAMTINPELANHLSSQSR